MATRARTRSFANSNATKHTVSTQEKTARTRSSSTKNEDGTDHDMDVEKENKTKSKGKAKTQTQTRAGGGTKAKKKSYCLCHQPDDGSPMVYCSLCKEWYHFRCVKLEPNDADDIWVYVCPPCTEKTGRRTVKDWEGPEALEEHSDDEPSASHHAPPPHTDSEEIDIGPAIKPYSESEGDPSSDEYVEDIHKSKGKASGAAKRRVRCLSFSSNTNSSSDESEKVKPGGSHKAQPASSKTASIKVSQSPVPQTTNLKRKSSVAQPPPAKRKKSVDPSANGDPARKYCLGKLQELFCPIFFKYPHVDSSKAVEIASEATSKVEQDANDLTDEVRARLEQEAKDFATELEQCVFDIYSEPDKEDKPSVGMKYKERFRMLTFNLSKPDRVVIHKRITLSDISPKELALMSSTDLANEETKESIKLMEKEALEHSILKKTTVPRAKITHKGLQDIEDVNGEVVGVREREREQEREREEEERRDRERQERLKAAQLHQQQRRASSVSTHERASAVPESPVVPQAPSWGGPPPLPLQSMHLDTHMPHAMAGDGRPSLTPLYVPSLSDFHSSPEPEMNLADLINIDEETSLSPQDNSASDHIHISAPTLESHVVEEDHSVTAPPLSASSPTTTPQTGIFPLSARPSEPESSTRSSFDLGSLWAAKPEDAATPPHPAQEPTDRKGPVLDAEIIGAEANDQDFDMFLEEKDQEEPTIEESPPSQSEEEVFQSLPLVWTGKVAMPIDSPIFQETPVLARQSGGRPLAADSPLWKTLFPTDVLRIEGRVAVSNSSQFLLQMRMNPTKELISVAFSPGGDEGGLQRFSDFLIGKNRHGLVFPWGPKPQEHQPGKELYMIPLLANEPLPDYMELLDELRLPKSRKSNYVVGIWILTKGRLAPPPAYLAAPPAPPIPPPALPSSYPPSMPPFNPPPAATALAIQSQPPVSATDLVAEVASLTPEQIQNMLWTLSAGNPLSVGTPLQGNNIPPTQTAPPPPPISQGWPSVMPNFPPQYPPNTSATQSHIGQPSMNMNHSIPHGTASPQRPPYHHASYEHHEYDRDYRSGAPSNRDHGRGWRNGDHERGGGRGRGRGRGRGNNSPRKPLDSGWPRARNRSNADAPSEHHSRWDEPPSRWS